MDGRRSRLPLVAGVALLVVSVALTVFAAARMSGPYERARDRCGDVPLRGVCSWEHLERVHHLRSGSLGVADVAALVALLGVVLLGAWWIRARPRLRARDVVVVGVTLVVLLRIAEALDYGSCDQPGFNDAEPPRIYAAMLLREVVPGAALLVALLGLVRVAWRRTDLLASLVLVAGGVALAALSAFTLAGLC